MSRVKVSSVLGSAIVPFSVAMPFSSTAASGLIVNVAATLLTARSNVTSACPPRLSVAVIVTVCVLSGPSVLSKDQDQFPLLPGSCVILPMDAETVTSSRSISENVPVYDAVCPSLTETAAVSTCTVGRLFISNSLS